MFEIACGIIIAVVSISIARMFFGFAVGAYAGFKEIQSDLVLINSKDLWKDSEKILESLGFYNISESEIEGLASRLCGILSPKGEPIDHSLVSSLTSKCIKYGDLCGFEISRNETINIVDIDEKDHVRSIISARGDDIDWLDFDNIQKLGTRFVSELENIGKTVKGMDIVKIRYSWISNGYPKDLDLKPKIKQ